MCVLVWMRGERERETHTHVEHWLLRSHFKAQSLCPRWRAIALIFSPSLEVPRWQTLGKSHFLWGIRLKGSGPCRSGFDAQPCLVSDILLKLCKLTGPTELLDLYLMESQCRYSMQHGIQSVHKKYQLPASLPAKCQSCLHHWLVSRWVRNWWK